MQCKAIKTTVCLLTLTILLSSNDSYAADWKLEKQQDNVSIYSRDSDSGYKEIWGKVVVEANPHALITLLNDVAFSTQWIHNCTKVKILNDISPTERLINSFFSVPWPAKDRDMVFYSKTTLTHNTVRIEIFDRGDTIPQHQEYVRMQNMHGLWQADALQQGRSEITYIGGGNPGGNLPTFIANRELISSTFQTFQNLSKVILLGRYQTIKITD